MSINAVTLVGRAGKDPEVRRMESGNVFANISLATSEKRKNASGETVEETQWHNLSFFGKTAEVVEKYVKKGDMIGVQGKITYRSYEKDGITKWVTEIRCSSLSLLGSPKEKEREKQERTDEDFQPIPQSDLSNLDTESPTVIPEDDLPF